MKVELATTDISVDSEIICPSTQASHVGIVRSVEGNSANIMERLSAHKRAVFAVLHAGLVRGHCANPMANLHVDKLYGVPVLLSGLSSLLLSLQSSHPKVS